MTYQDIHSELVLRCKTGDRIAQNELYRLYHKALYHTCLRMCGRIEDAEDLLQQSFIDIYTHLDSFKFQSTIGAWMKRIVINNCINFLQRKRFQWDEIQDQDMEKNRDQDESGVDVTYTVEKIKSAMQQLSDGYRTVFSLYMFEGYDHEEIAEILNITESTSKSQLHRAKQRIRESLEVNRS